MLTSLLSVYRKFPWKKFPIYMIAQILGAMTASAIVYGASSLLL
jgi:glycerol uptake facilitator-like aquaporin